MEHNYNQQREETLDPQDWDEFTKLSHQIIEDMMNYLRTIRDQTCTPPTKLAKGKIVTPLPLIGDGEEAVYNLVKKYVIPYGIKHTRPDFWGHVAGTGSPYGMLVETIIAGMNHAVGHGPLSYINQQAFEWVREMLDFPEVFGGVFVSGGSEANFTGLAVARNAKSITDMKRLGMQGVPQKMTLYCSDETHGCLERSIELLGFGYDALRWIKTDSDCRIVLSSLIDAIKDDRLQGYQPICVIGNAGTVNNGSFDDLDELAEICNKMNLWLHVDAVFGAWVRLTQKYSHLAEGLERADSVAVDLHKWMNMPYNIACTLVRDRVAHYRTFSYGKEAKYLRTAFEEQAKASDNFLEMSLALSAPDYGLKAYMLLRAFGLEKYRLLVEQNIDQIIYLGELIKKEPNLVLIAPIISNIACFRYEKEGLDESEIEDLNKLILSELSKINLWMVSDTRIKGKYTLRACNVNHRTRRTDFEILVERVKTIGDILVREIV